MLQRILAALLAASLLPISIGHVYAEESCEGLARVGDRVGIKFQIAGYQTVEKPYAAIVLIKDSHDATVQLSWLTGVLHPNHKIQLMQSWAPEAIGVYTAEVFIWSSMDNTGPLMPTKELRIVVNC